MHAADDTVALIDEALARSTGLAHSLRISALRSGKRLELTLADTAAPPTPNHRGARPSTFGRGSPSSMGTTRAWYCVPAAATTEFVLSLPFNPPSMITGFQRGST